MTIACKSLYSWPRIARLAAIVIIFAVASAVANAQTQDTGSQKPPTTTPEALFQDSTLTGTTNTINVNWLPVVTSTGSIIYDDVVIQFDVAADGTLTVAAGYPVVTPSPRAIIDHFRAGNYVGPSNDTNFLITVSGPGVGDGGATDWSLVVSTGGSTCTLPSLATWWVGPIKKSPYWPRIKAAGVPLENYSYGVGGNPNCGSGGKWNDNSLLGFTETSNGSFVITSFTLNGTDQSQPVDEIPYSYCNGKNGCKQNR